MESFVVTDPGGNLTHGIVQFSTDSIANGTIINDDGTGSLAVTGNKNYFPETSNVGTLTSTVFGAGPLFSNPTTVDFTLQNASPAFGIADTSVNPQPAIRFFSPPPISNPTSTPPWPIR